MYLSARAGWMLMGALLLIQTGQAAEGPQNGGLRLGLTIAPVRLSQAELVRSAQYPDRWQVKLELKNTEPQPVTLMGNWPYQELAGDYAEYLKSAVELITYPQVLPPTAQTAGSQRESAQPTYVLKQGAALTVQWEASSRRLKPQDCFGIDNTTPFISTSGLYGVRATVVVITDKNERFLLVSNEQQIAVGGSTELPKHSTARLTAVDAQAKTAMIDLGSDHRVSKSDQFEIRHGLAASWLLTLTEVHDTWSAGTVTEIHRSGNAAPAFPQEQWLATLQPDRAK